MSNLEIVSIILGVTAGIETMLLIGFSFLKSKGINTQDVLEKTDKALTATEGVINVASAILPGNPIVDGLKVVEKYAHVGVNQAEQLYLASQLPADQRNVKAKETIYAAVTAANITVTPELQKIIDGAIEAEVLALGHKTPTESEKAAQLAKIQEENNKLIQDNQVLNQKLSNVAAQINTK